MRCYTLIPRASGTLENWCHWITHLADLGFNTVHVLPMTRMGTSHSPYSSTNPFAIDQRYCHQNTPAEEQLEAFIQFLIKKKIRLCVDLVVNHLAIDHPMLQQHPEWCFADPHEQDGIKRAGWSDGTHWHAWRDLALLNYAPHQGRLLWQYMFEYSLYWASIAARTGGLVRFDNMHSTYQPFAEYCIAHFRRKYPSLRIYGEMFAPEQEMRQMLKGYACHYLLATQWEHKSTPSLRGYLQYIHSAALPVRYFTPALSHDSGSLTQEYGSAAGAQTRMVISALLGSGDWGIPQGTEYGLAEPLRFIGPPEPQGEHLFQPDTTKLPQFAPLITALNGLLRDYTLFNLQGNIFFPLAHHENIMAAVRYLPEDRQQHCLILVNTDTKHQQECRIPRAELEHHGITPQPSYCLLFINPPTQDAHDQRLEQGTENYQGINLSLAAGESIVLGSIA